MSVSLVVSPSRVHAARVEGEGWLLGTEIHGKGRTPEQGPGLRANCFPLPPKEDDNNKQQPRAVTILLVPSKAAGKSRLLRTRRIVMSVIKERQ